MIRVAVIDSGVANLASVVSALRGLGTEVTTARSVADLDGASHLVLPGVGAFGPAIRSLRRRGLDTAILRAAGDGKPLLGICLGMQLLGEASDEAPGEAGLGLLSGRFTRLPAGQPIPHLGWNGVVAAAGDPLLVSGNAAFANSYCLRSAPAGWRPAWTTYGEAFVSALARDRILACQFHPELSSSFGQALLRRD